MVNVIVNGDIFESKCQTIVNTVNCVGIMGKGLALAFKEKYPEMFVRYKELCDRNLFEIGKLWIYKSSDKWVLNFPTKIHWKYNSEYSYIEEGLNKFIKTYKEKGITSIAFPMLGCANGKLDKKNVLGMMIEKLSVCDIPIEIYMR